ncbi:MAG: hypothetical protein WAU90_00380, partial [Methyloceanibacter sp.]
FHFANADIQTVASIATLIIPWGLGLVSEEPDLNPLQEPFAKLVTRIKHPGFAEEREVRIVYVRPDDSTVPEDRLPPKPVHFRPHAGGWVPYIKLFDTPHMPLPISRIVVGPHRKGRPTKKDVGALPISTWHQRQCRDVEDSVSS